jgi:anti-sigma factor RsiW
MTEPTPHLGDEIQELLDGRLDPAREMAVRAHLAACDACRQEWQRLEWLKTRLRGLADAPPVPTDLASTIRTVLDREGLERSSATEPVDASSASPASASRRVSRARLGIAAGIAALLVVAIGGGLFWWLAPPSPSEIAGDYESLERAALHVQYATADPRELERRFAARGGIPTRVYDLGMMHYTLVGGRAHAHRGQPGTLAVYRGARGERVICEMYSAPPPRHAPIDRRTHNGIEFTVYRQGAIVMVFWDEGPVTCVLAAIMDPEALVQLAFAKAGRPS